MIKVEDEKIETDLIDNFVFVLKQILQLFSFSKFGFVTFWQKDIGE